MKNNGCFFYPNSLGNTWSKYKLINIQDIKLIIILIKAVYTLYSLINIS